MSDNKNSEQLLQDCVDELFALQDRVSEDQKKFVLESATLIKASQKHLSEALDLVHQAKQSARQSEQAAKEASQSAALYETDARFWKRFAFWTGLGFFIMGALLAFTLWLMGKRYAEYRGDLKEPSTLSKSHRN